MSGMLKVFSPFDQKLIQEIPFSDEKEIEDALKVSSELFLKSNEILPSFQRIEILEKTIEIMKGKAEELIQTACLEGGKPFQDTKIELSRAINGVKIAVQSISQLKGEEIPMGLTESSLNRIAFTTREPIGVVLSISAYNHPINLMIHQVITAIASGCPVIIKPALTTPISCLKIVDILYQAGLPKEYCKVIICKDELAEKMVMDRRIHFFSFIGSSRVGWSLRSKLSPGVRCALEHGGVAPVIIEKDCVLDEIVSGIVKGSFYHAGQVCVSVQKIFVHEDIVDEFLKIIVRETKKLKIGNPLEPDTDVGPLILPKEVDRVESWVNDAILSGAKLVVGGNKISNSFYEPTILLNPSEDSKVSKSEIFGPVVCIYPFRDYKEAIQLANSLDMHFQASIFTKNLDITMDCIKLLNANTVLVNDHTAFRVDWMPFGGRDASGLGTGGILYSMWDMTKEKLIIIKNKFL